MKPHALPLVTTCAAAGFLGAFVAVAQPLRPPEAIIVQVADIDREFVSVRAQPQQSSTDLTSIFREQRGFLTFHFERQSQRQVDALVQDGVRSKRPVRIMDGSRLITECSMVGASGWRKGRSVTRHGLVLAFDSLAEAERAGIAMRGYKPLRPPLTLDYQTSTKKQI